MTQWVIFKASGAFVGEYSVERIIVAPRKKHPIITEGTHASQPSPAEALDGGKTNQVAVGMRAR